MTIALPNLDDRRFKDLVDEMRALIPRYAPDWTNHNISDPGIALVEMFAFLTEAMIYRLNRVPKAAEVLWASFPVSWTSGTRAVPWSRAFSLALFHTSLPLPSLALALWVSASSTRWECVDCLRLSTPEHFVLKWAWK